MSNQIAAVGLDILTPGQVDFYIIPNLTNLPATYDVRGTVRDQPDGNILSQTNSPGTPGEITYYSSHPGVLTQNTTYWVQFDILDTANGNAVVATGGRWISTPSTAQFQDSGPAFNECGDDFPPEQDRVKYFGHSAAILKGGEAA